MINDRLYNKVGTVCRKYRGRVTLKKENTKIGFTARHVE